MCDMPCKSVCVFVTEAMFPIYSTYLMISPSKGAGPGAPFVSVVPVIAITKGKAYRPPLDAVPPSLEYSYSAGLTGLYCT